MTKDFVNLHNVHTVHMMSSDELPSELRAMRSLRTLILQFDAVRLPPWFAELPLVSLDLFIRDVAEPFCRWFRAQGALPPSLRQLRVRSIDVRIGPGGYEWCDPLTRDLSLERFAHQLLSLSAGNAHLGGRYGWLASSAIVHLEVITPLVEPLVAALRKMRVRSLSLSRESQE